MPFEDTINSVPQSDTNAIARRLLGDSMVERFGDAIGARPYDIRDTARDFALGMSGGPEKAEELKMQAREQFQKAYDREAASAVRQEQHNRETATMVLSSLKTASQMPGNRALIFQDTLDQAGIPYSKAAVKLLTDADTLGNLPIEDLMAKAQTGEVSMDSIASVLGSARAAASWYTDMIRAEKDRRATGNAILEAETKALRLKDIQAKMAEREKLAPFRETRAREGAKTSKLNTSQKRKKLAEAPKGGGVATAFENDLAAVTAAASGRQAATPTGKSGIKSITEVK